MDDLGVDESIILKRAFNNLVVVVDWIGLIKIRLLGWLLLAR